MYGGPSPRIRALASQDKLTQRNWLASFGVTNRSKPVSVFAALLIAHRAATPAPRFRRWRTQHCRARRHAASGFARRLRAVSRRGRARFRDDFAGARGAPLQAHPHLSGGKSSSGSSRIENSTRAAAPPARLVQFFEALVLVPACRRTARHVWTSKTQLEMEKNRLGGLARNFSAGGVRADPNERR